MGSRTGNAFLGKAAGLVLVHKETCLLKVRTLLRPETKTHIQVQKFFYDFADLVTVLINLRNHIFVSATRSQIGPTFFSRKSTSLLWKNRNRNPGNDSF